MKKLMMMVPAMLLGVSCCTYAASFGPEYDQIVAYFQSEAEPEAMDAIWGSESLLKIGMFDHDKDFTAYAEHVCELLQKQGLQNNKLRVQIIDLKKLAELEQWVVLGKAECN